MFVHLSLLLLPVCSVFLWALSPPPLSLFCCCMYTARCQYACSLCPHLCRQRDMTIGICFSFPLSSPLSLSFPLSLSLFLPPLSLFPSLSFSLSPPSLSFYLSPPSLSLSIFLSLYLLFLSYVYTHTHTLTFSPSLPLADSLAPSISVPSHPHTPTNKMFTFPQG